MSGSTARLISHYRPIVPIYAFTPNETVYRRLSLFWGVNPVKTKFYKTFEALEKQIFPVVAKLGLAKKGDTVIITGGHPTSECGPTNFLKIQTLDNLDQ
jgi:pyruvate kinase